MGKFIDLAGQKKDMLTVEEKTKDRDKCGRIIYKCRCDCGNVVYLNSANLKSRESLNCGCVRKNELVGKIFGRLTVIEQTKDMMKNKHRRLYYKCKCKCGNEIEVVEDSLIQEDTKSCGCLNSETASKNIKNMVYKGTQPKKLEKTKSRVNQTGRKGVYALKDGRYKAMIMLRYKAYNLGIFDKIEDAIKARKQAEEELFQPILKAYQEEKAGV